MTHLEEPCPHIEDRNHSVLESVFRGHRRCIKRREATVVFIGKCITFFSCFVIGFFFLLPSVASTEALCEGINRCRLPPEGSLSPPKRMNFRKISKRRGGVISDLKNFIAIFFALETVIFVMNFRKNFKKRGVGSFPI